MNLNTFEQSGLSLYIEKDGQVLFQSEDHMLKPLIQAIKEKNLKGAVVYDKLVGRGAALLFVYAKIAKVFTLTASKNALTVLKENQIPITTKTVVDNIMNNNGTDICPMEKLSVGKTPSEFFKLLSNK